ncbi:MAG: hypothetical protein FWD01_03585 [Defluviitaleaceae bacterium]|nr:hypothetical protein [Defluviitaleaceae bacterium]
MKNFRKIMAFALVLVFTFAIVTSVSANQIRVYNEDGVQVNIGNDINTRGGGYYFGGGCWFTDADGNVVNARGMRMYDVNGNPITQNQWQTMNGNGTRRRGGGCCWW